MVLYFTGTGNSKYIAERIASALKDDVLSMNDRIKAGNTDDVMTGKNMVIVVPTYAWRIPRVVLNWLQQTKFPEAMQIWFVMDCGGEIGNAAKYNQELSKQLRLSYMGTAQIVMPENYIAMFKVPDKVKAKAIVAKAEPLIDKVIKDIQAEREFSKPRNHMYDKIMSSAVNTIFYPMFVKADKFLVTDACVSCGKCIQVCPLNNIQLKNGKPAWGSNCTHCMACICYCPTEAIEYGKKSKGKPRYTFEKIVDEKRRIDKNMNFME